MVKDDILVNATTPIKEALKKLDRAADKVLLVLGRYNKLLGTVTDGDIRRHILSGKSLEEDIAVACNRKPMFIKKEDYSAELVRDKMVKANIRLIPILDKDGRVVDAVSWSRIFSKEITDTQKKGNIDIPVVIMAGGRGSRLDPFTRILPKALIPLGNKTVIDMIIDEFRNWGIRQYYVTLNHHADIVETYFNSAERDYEIKFVREKIFLGTAGGLKYLEKEIDDLFIVSNCDVIVKADFAEVISLHKKQRASMTVLSAIQHHKVPYGVIKYKEKGEVTEITEKPEYTLTINTGVYVLSKECLRFIPDKTPINMTDVISKLIANNKTVLTYPVNESSYMDIGQWEEYKKIISSFHERE